MKRYILYVKTGCPYVLKVKNFTEPLGIEFEERNISDPAIAEELIERGGKRQVPYIVDIEKAIEMYESEDIIEYLKTEAAEGQ